MISDWLHRSDPYGGAALSVRSKGDLELRTEPVRAGVAPGIRGARGPVVSPIERSSSRG
jgi:hypothetical protein